MKRQNRPLPLLLLLACGVVVDAHAFTVAISPASRSLYLRVGDGAFTNRDFDSGGTPQSGGASNVVTVNVSAAQLMSGADLAMTSTSRLTSDYDGFSFCSTGQTYIGGFYRLPGNSGTATLTATVTTPLTSGTSTIPFSQIRWTASGNSDSGAQPVAANNFGDVSKNIATFPVNSWRESCHSFFYDNDNVVAAGTYVGRITYTLTAP